VLIGERGAFKKMQTNSTRGIAAPLSPLALARRAACQRLAQQVRKEKKEKLQGQQVSVNTEIMYTLGQERPELPLPECDPPSPP
jgi:hypothetical protein